MQIALATLADYAAVTDRGKLVIGGVFDSITLAGVPSRYASIAVALRMRVGPGEPHPAEVSIRLVDPDGEGLVPELKGRLGNAAGPQEGGALQFVVHLSGVRFKQFGPHQVDILLDGRPVHSLPLIVLEAPKRGPHAAPDPEADEVSEPTED